MVHKVHVHTCLGTFEGVLFVSTNIIISKKYYGWYYQLMIMIIIIAFAFY